MNTEEIPYREEVAGLFSNMPVMTYGQFVRSVFLLTGLKNADITNVINILSYKGAVLISENGYVTTKNALDIVVKNAPEIRKTSYMRLPAIRPMDTFMNLIDCYPLILDMYPDSYPFRVSRSLFQVAFFNEHKGTEFEIVRIPVNKEDLYRRLIIQESAGYASDKHPGLRECLRRIAVVENEACALKVPYAGFNFITMPDKDSPKGFRIIEKRTNDIWHDVI